MDFTKKKCEDIVSEMIDRNVPMLEDINREIVFLEKIQDKMLGNEYNLDKTTSKEIHKEVSSLIRKMYAVSTEAEQQVYAKVLAVVECEKD